MWKIILWLGLTLILLPLAGCTEASDFPGGENGSNIVLPTPHYDSRISVEQALRTRRSVRVYTLEPLVIAEVSQLLWAAQGFSHPDGQRTAPSAGALYPLEIYLLAGNVKGLQAGLYHYQPQDHMLILIDAEDKRQGLFEAALQQKAVKDAAIVCVISAVYERTTGKYGQRGIRYVHTEVGYAAQNIYLQAEALGLGTVFIGAFHEDEVKSVLQMSEEEVPLGLMPVGKKLHSDEAAP